jgi:NitT/TauT family transport system permease protein
MADAQRTPPDASRFGRDNILVWQVALVAGLLAFWEIAGRVTGGDQVSSPSRIGGRIATWLGGELYPHLLTTLSELACGMAIGCGLGILAGLVLGRMPIVSLILRPIIVGLYSVPLVTLAPLFIMFFGLGLMPKIVLVSIVTFFLLFFNTFTGARQVDEDYLRTLDLMGATRFEQFRKVILPATAVWIAGGIKIALPYALVATITGELLATRAGLGFLISRAAERFDMTSLYAVLLILMALGLLLSEAALRLEHRFLRWRTTAEEQ